MPVYPSDPAAKVLLVEAERLLAVPGIVEIDIQPHRITPSNSVAHGQSGVALGRKDRLYGAA